MDSVLRWLDGEPKCKKLMERYSIAAFVDMVRRRVETEGLRPFAIRTGIPLGQLRSVTQDRAARSTTLRAIAAVMGMRLFIAPMNPGDAEAPPLPRELTRALDLPADASVAEAVDAINTDAAGSDLRKAMRLMQEMAELATSAADLLPRLADESAIRMVPFTEQVQFDSTTGELEFKESSAVAIAVAERVLPSWAQADRLTCVQVAGDSPTATDGALVVVDRDRRVPVEQELFVVGVDDALVVKRLLQVRNRQTGGRDRSAHVPKRLAAAGRIVGRVAWCCPHGATAG